MKLFNFFLNFLSRYKKTLALILIVSTTTLLISNAISIWLSDFHNLTLPTIGNIKTLGVEAYWDPDGENRTETIYWETVWAGTTRNVTLYIRSVSNVETTLHIHTSNITPPEISEYIDLSWDYNGSVFSPDEIIPVTLFLSAPGDMSFSRYLIDNNVTQFNIDIHFVAYERPTPQKLSKDGMFQFPENPVKHT